MTNSEIKNFESENIDKIIEMKVNAGPNQFVYLSEDGNLKHGNKNDYGHSAVEMYGGSSKNKGLAGSDLEYIFSMRKAQ